MKKFFSSLSQTTVGFTMIELLIVIAILGILAVAVLSAINPVEQINRGRDTGSRSDAEQLLSAIDRFNAFQGHYPWQYGAADPVTAITPITEWAAVDDIVDHSANLCPVADKLSAATAPCTGTDELKVSYFTRIFGATYNYLWIYNRGTQGDSTYICFTPKSKAFLTEAQARCGVAGAGLPADLIGQSAVVCAAGEEMICLP